MESRSRILLGVIAALFISVTSVLAEAQLTNASTDCPDNASVWLMVNDSYLCSGTLVAMDWVLTSAHCVEDFQYGYGGLDDMGASYWEASIEHVILHPLWAGGGPEPADHLHDLAMVWMTEAAPREYALAGPLDAAVGTAVTLDGYGSTGVFRRDYGVHRCGTAVVDQYVDGLWGFNTAPGEVAACLGDSGAGVYAGGELGAVISGAEAPLAILACRTGTVWAAPVDVTWINAVVGYTAQSP